MPFSIGLGRRLSGDGNLIGRIMRRAKSKASAAYGQQLLATVKWITPEGSNPMAVAFAGAQSGAGATTTAVATAITAAGADRGNILLVDGHSERAQLHETFGVDLAPGLGESIADLERLAAAIHSTSVARLFVLPAGAESDCSADGQAAFVRLLATLKADFELVVFDMPPVNRFVPSLSWLAHLDASLMVVAEDSDAQNAVVGKRIMAGLGVKFHGIVLNKR